MNARYGIVGYNGCVLAASGNIKGAYRYAARINRIADMELCVEIADRKTGEKYSLTCNSRRRNKLHGQDILDRFSAMCDAFDRYERRNSFTEQGQFAYEMFDIGFSLI